MLGAIDGHAFHLFGVHHERILQGSPGELIAQRHGAVCRATIDGAVWITQLKRHDTPTPRYFKLPAMLALELVGVDPEVPDVGVPLDARLRADHTYREIAHEGNAGVGYLRFDFYNGAMSTEQCLRLRDAYAYARGRATRAIVLLGGDDYFSNGIHLGVIEAADDPGAESWRNLNAIDDLVRDILETDSHLVISALAGDAAAGGVPLALAGDYVVAREDIVLNPYYQHMGRLCGSEPAASPCRHGDDHAAHPAPVQPRRHQRGDQERIAQRRSRSKPGRISRSDTTTVHPQERRRHRKRGASMHSDLKLEVVTTAELDCPSCGAPMEIIDRFTLYGVPAAVEHVKVRCIVGHWFTTPTEWLARADRDPRAAYQEVAANARRLPGTPLSREQMGTSGERSARPLTNGSAHSAAIALGD